MYGISFKFEIISLKLNWKFIKDILGVWHITIFCSNVSILVDFGFDSYSMIS